MKSLQDRIKHLKIAEKTAERRGVPFKTRLAVRELEILQYDLHSQMKFLEHILNLPKESWDYPEQGRDCELEIGVLKRLCGCKECKGG